MLSHLIDFARAFAPFEGSIFQALCLLMVMGFLIVNPGCASRVGPIELIPGVEVEAGYATDAPTLGVEADVRAKVAVVPFGCVLLGLIGLDSRVAVCPTPVAPEPAPAE